MKDTIIIHCSATRAGQNITAADIDCWHRARGFWSIGYHYVIRLDGTIEPGRDVTLDGAHCMGWNQRFIGICYVGGLDKEGRPADHTDRCTTHCPHPTGEISATGLPQRETGHRTPGHKPRPQRRRHHLTQ